VVVGSGPNGLAAAITVAQAGRSVLLVEAEPTAGGGVRTMPLTLPGFLHDRCSAVHPLALASPFFRSLQLETLGLRWADPPIALAHPLDDGPPGLLYRSLDETGRSLRGDGARWSALMAPFVAQWDALVRDALAPLHLPRHPLLLGRFGLVALRSADGLVRRRFREAPSRALLAGISAHAAVPLTRAATASFGLVLALAGHAAGWPIPVGGSQAIADALVAQLRALGGELATGTPVRSLAELPPARLVLLDITPRQFLELAGERLPPRYRAALGRYRYGAGVCKVDWALSDPVPWRDAECARAGTVHLGGTLDEVVAAEEAPWRGEHAERPFTLLAQQSLFDASRAPAGRHTLWGYCHVPNGSPVDMTNRIEAQIERFAPGFRDCVVARHAIPASEMHRDNANLVGGEISGGAGTLDQLFFRPVAQRVPYATPLQGVYLCSSSTPPGAGVHGLCGWFAARAALAGDR
jgi:phytoene dehydrogenase-like protein